MDANPELQRTFIRITRELGPLKDQLAALTSAILEKEAALEQLKDHAPAAPLTPGKGPVIPTVPVKEAK